MATGERDDTLSFEPLRELHTGLLCLLIGVHGHAQITIKRRRARVDLERCLQVLLGKVVLLLSEVDVAQPVPSVVVALVETNSRSVARGRLFKVLIRGVLVAGESVRVGEVGLQLNRSLKKLEGCVVFLLQGEAVPNLCRSKAA